MKKFLITGGAGYFGSNLARFLVEKGHTVVTLDIADITNEDTKDKITAIKGDIRDKMTVAQAMDGVDIVVHAAAALPLYSSEDIFSTEIDGTRIILETAYAKNIERTIFISSTAVYGIPDHHPLKEDDKLQGVGPYGEAKIQAEYWCRTYQKKGMCVPILRPKTFVGPERLGVFAMLYEWAKEGHNFPILGKGNNRYQLLDVFDLCEATYLAATVDIERVNDTFNIGAKEFTTLKQDFQAVLDEAGFGKRMLSFPATPVIWGLKILEYFKLSPLYQWIYETVAHESFVSIEKAESVLGYKPQFSNRDALVRNYRWFVDEYDPGQEQYGISHTVAWKQGALKLIKVFF